MPPNQGAVKLHLGFQSELRMIEYEDCCFLLRQVLQLWQEALFRTLHHEFIGDDRFTMVYYGLPRLPTNIPLGCKHPTFTNPPKNGGGNYSKPSFESPMDWFMDWREKLAKNTRIRLKLVIL